MTKRRGLMVAALAAALGGVAVTLVVAGLVHAHARPNTISIQLSPESVVLSLSDRQALGFEFGPPDGYLGVHRRDNVYTFFVPGHSSANCSTPNVQGTFRLGGSLTQLTNAYGCSVSLGDGADPNGYSFDRDYSGGGPVAGFKHGGTPGILMVYHGEWHPGGTCNSVPWFYGSLGMAVSTDAGASFSSLGEIIQPYPTRSQGLGTMPSCQNVHVGYGTLVLADEQGNTLPTGETSNPIQAYYYVFYTDSDPTAASPCDQGAYCVAVARARRSDLIDAAVSGNTAAFPSLFTKYYNGSFSEPGTGQDPENGVNSGHYTPLFGQVASQPTVIYDRAIGQFLMVYQSAGKLAIQASPNLLQWSGIPLANGTIDDSPNVLGYATLVGEGKNPHVGGLNPYLFYLSAAPPFPDWGSMGTNYVSRRIQITAQ